MDVKAVVGSQLISTLIPLAVQKAFVVCKNLSKKVQIRLDTAFKEYLDRSFDSHSQVKTLIHRNEPRFLYDIFECNKLSFYRNSKNSLMTGPSSHRLLKISNFIMMLGTAGIGKSTMMRHLFLDSIKKKNRVPIFLELRKLNNNPVSLLQFMLNTINEHGGDLEAKDLEYALKRGPFIILLDGFDEIVLDKHESVMNEINALCNAYPKNGFVVSSREDDSLEMFRNFTVMRPMPLSLAQAVSLIERLAYDEEIKAEFIKRLRSDLYKKHKEFASNPLLLNIMLLSFQANANIPDKMNDFYDEAFLTLYRNHDFSKGGYRRELKCGLDFGGLKSVFSAFCFQSYMLEKYNFTHDQILQTIKDSIEVNNIKEPKCTASNYLDDLTMALCIIIKDGNQYTFSHRSFQEYFTAFYINELPNDAYTEVCLGLVFEGVKNAAILNLLMDIDLERFEINCVLPFIEDLNKRSPLGREFVNVFPRIFHSVDIFVHESDLHTKTLFFTTTVLGHLMVRYYYKRHKRLGAARVFKDSTAIKKFHRKLKSDLPAIKGKKNGYRLGAGELNNASHEFLSGTVPGHIINFTMDLQEELSNKAAEFHSKMKRIKNFGIKKRKQAELYDLEDRS